MKVFFAPTLVLLLLAATVLHAQVPQLINYQGRIAVNGVNFTGSGQFKFALVDSTATTSYWSNDGTSTAGSEPAAAVTLSITNGRYSVLLGDTTVPNMATIPSGVFNNDDVFVRVWFNDGSNGSQQLTPDQRTTTIAPVNAPAVRGGSPSAATDSWQFRAGGMGTLLSARDWHTAVWTGSEMIVWGGSADGGSFFNTGGSYNPAGNSWKAVTTVGAPAARNGDTAVWTGSEMIVWGGFSSDGGHHFLNDGGRYNPAGNSWVPVSTTGAPTARWGHTAVWTGSEMIVWGGEADQKSTNDGGRYNPAGNRWTAVSTTGAPNPRWSNTVVWTGTEMIVWGGSGLNDFLNTGGRYHPADDSWTVMTNTGAPAGRFLHTAVWTGSEMIIWGGYAGGSGLNDGGRYKPADNSWTAVTATGAPDARMAHSAVWTGREMVIWGGYTGTSPLNDGRRYNPAGNSWTTVTTTGAPRERCCHTAVWTGSEMIIWGGHDDHEEINLKDGGRYNLAADSWTGSIAASPRVAHTAVWTGSEMIIWGGRGGDRGYLNDGESFHPAGNTWVPVSDTGAPGPRYGHSALWTGSEMIVWGGYNPFGGPFTSFDGGRYHPAINSWLPMSTVGAPAGRADHTAVWTGNEMIVWGGSSEDALNDGGRYDPAGNRWTAVSATGAPTARWGHTAVWTDSEMIVWGGTPDFSGGLNDGGRYHPADDRWSGVSTTSAPAARRSHTAVWTGSEMIIWGGGVFPNASSGGGRYHPEENLWTPVSTAGAPDARFHHTAVWTGDEMIVWGGTPDFFNNLNTGGRYHPAGDSWKAVTTVGAPAARTGHTAVWTGSEMIVSGGWDGISYFNDTFSYTPDCGVFDFTSVVRSGGNLTLSFPTVTGRTYTLWRSATLSDDSWVNSGLAALAGTGTILTFTIPAPAATWSFFRVQAMP